LTNVVVVLGLRVLGLDLNSRYLEILVHHLEISLVALDHLKDLDFLRVFNRLKVLDHLKGLANQEEKVQRS